MPAPASERRSVAHYELAEKIGEGGMGAVYRAHDRKLERTVALKFLRSESIQSPAIRSRFLQEARAVSRLSHRNIAVIHAIEECEGETFLVFEYLSGGTLRSMVDLLTSRGAVLEARQAAAYALAMAEGLAVAHANGIIHRDIKPGNVMFARDGSLKLVDFGISKLLDDGTRTAEGKVLGTPVYMSPEQAQGKEVDERSDIFSLGLVLFEMVAGRPPFRAESSDAVMHQIIHEPLPPVPDTCPAELASIIQRTAAKQPAARYQHMVDVAADLRRYLRTQSATGELPTTTMAADVPRRRIAVIALVTPAVAVTAIAGLLLLREWPSRLPPGPKRIAILPFENPSSNPVDQAFCDGLLESAIAALHQIQPELVVTPSPEIRRLSIKNADGARRLAGANLVISGKVRRSSQRVDVTLDVFAPPAQKALDFSHVAQEAGQSGSIQEKTGVALAKMLGLKIAGKKLNAASSVPAANESYLEGIGYAQRYDVKDNLAKAVDALERTTRAAPDFTAAHIALSMAYQSRYRDIKDRQFLDRARESAGKAVALEDSSTGAHMAAGGVLSLGGDPDGAIAELRRALALDPLNGDALRELASAYNAGGRSAEAEATYRKAAELRPNDPMTIAQAAQFQYAHQQYAEAEKGFLAAIALVPDSPLHHRNLGGVYIAMGRSADAERELLASIKLEPTAGAYSNLGALYIYAGRYEDAIGALQKAISLSPARTSRTYSLWGNLGDAYRYTPGESAKASDAYRTAIEQLEQQLAFDPDNARLLASMAEYAAKMGDRGRALDAVGRAMRFARGDRTVSFKAGLVYELTGSRERALAAIGDAIRGGYSLDEVGREPEFSKLRQDPRYQQSLPAQPDKAGSR